MFPDTSTHPSPRCSLQRSDTKIRKLVQKGHKVKLNLHVMCDIIVPYDCHMKPARDVGHSLGPQSKVSPTWGTMVCDTAYIGVVTVLEADKARAIR